MEGQAVDQKLIAQGRSEEIKDLDSANLCYRVDLANAEPGTDLHRVHQVVNQAQFFYNQSTARSMRDKDNEEIREHIEETMMSHDALYGAEDRK